MKLYEKFDYLAYWFRYQATYLEMKYHLKQVLAGKEEYYIKNIRHCDRNIGKSAALARLSVKYDIPVIVPTNKWKGIIERDIPRRIPKYFKRRKPTAFVANLPDRALSRALRQNIVLMEEGMDEKQIDIANRMSNGKVVGYRSLI